jgi:hypothetical protein
LHSEKYTPSHASSPKLLSYTNTGSRYSWMTEWA